METRRYPVDTHTFSKVIEGNCVYVDKTDLVYKMTHDFDYVFLSRPRRFGKSLLCSTLKEYFSGSKDLFKGLKIYGLETEWTQYPVINLSFASAKDVTENLLQLKDGIQDFANANGLTVDKTIQYFKAKFDGYHFSYKTRDVFNPYSVIKSLNEKRFSDFWFNSGTPTALLKIIAKFDVKMEDYEGVECSESRFNKPVEKVTDLVPFLFQSGYLTIKNYKSVNYGIVPTSVYTLGYPNDEVRAALADSLFKNYYKIDDTMPLRNAYFDFYVNDDIVKFIKALQKFFRKFPFSLNNMNEKHYHSILYTVLTSFSADISANQETALGKSDLILKMPKTVYVIELKYDRSLDSAVDQIDDRDYVSAVLDSNKRIVKLAIKFSSKDRNIESYEATEEKVS